MLKIIKITAKICYPIGLSRAYRFSTQQSFDHNKDYYKILGVTKSSTSSQIKNAYYKLAKQFHPDLNKGNQSKFKEINQAYSVLSDQKIKRDYESARQYGPSQSNYGPYGQQGRSQYQYQSSYQRAYRQHNNPYTNTHQWQRNYQNPYQNYGNNWQYNRSQFNAYQQFMRQAQKNRQEYSRRRQQQQYEQQKQYQTYYKEDPLQNFQSSIRRSFLTGLIIATMMMVILGTRNKNQQQYYSKMGNDEGYEIVNVRGYPVMQKVGHDVVGNYNGYHGPTQYGNGVMMSGPQARTYM